MKVHSWNAEDFTNLPRRPKTIGDFWEPYVVATPNFPDPGPIEADWWAVDNVPLRDGLASAASANGFQDSQDPTLSRLDAIGCSLVWSDFWDPVPGLDQPKFEPADGSAWYDELRFRAFDPTAHEAPYVEKVIASPKETLARKCAGAILKLADATFSQQRLLLGRFVELFTDYPHPSSFRAIANLIREDASLEDILAAYDLRCTWIDNPSYSLMRSRKGSFFIPDGYQGILTWKLAHSLVIRSRGTPPELLIDPSWVDEWMDLPVGDGLSFQFVSYVAARIDAFDQGALEAPTIDRRNFRWGTRDLVTIDGFRIVDEYSRTASLTGHYVNPFGSYRSPKAKKQEEADV